MDHPILKGNCYVLHQGIADVYKLIGRAKNEMIMWPERSLTMLELRKGIRYERSIVTENPHMIAVYDKRKVWYWDKGQWKNPMNQTYGGSYSSISIHVLKINSTIPFNVISREDGDIAELQTRLQYEPEMTPLQIRTFIANLPIEHERKVALMKIADRG